MIVVGSGPAGIAAAQALADRGCDVTILDVGRGPEKASRKYEILREQTPAEWDEELLEDLRSEFGVGHANLPLKPLFGSLHPYAPDDLSAPRGGDGVGLMPSLARGGLSTVWGGAMLPYRDSDLGDWPLTRADLEPYYRAVLGFVPMAGRHDDLAEEFPLYVTNPQDLLPTDQVRAFLTDLDRNSARLKRREIAAGRARVAVRTQDSEQGRGCRYVGLCLHGCPLGSVWSSAQTLEVLEKEGRVRYRAGAYVERFEERQGAVTVTFSTNSGREQLSASRLFIAAGTLPSTRLVLRSLDAVGKPILLRDSQYYTFPLLRSHGSSVGVSRQGNTLAQAFIELNDSTDATRSAHLQVYGYSDLVLREVASTLRLKPAAAERMAGPLLSRLLFCQGYLHSSRSQSIRAELVDTGSDARLHLTPISSRRAVRREVFAVLRKLVLASRWLKAVPVGPMLRVWEPGRGVHVGGSFPMHAKPQGLQSDLLGRPCGLDRVHIVDSSVFPSIPPTTITLTVMANAHRIATQAVES